MISILPIPNNIFKKQRATGFTLLEIMLAVAFFVVAFMSLMDAYKTGVFADLYLDKAAVAVNLAQEKIEECKRGTYGILVPGTTIEPYVANFSFFNRTTQISMTTGSRSSYKTINVTVGWMTETNPANYSLLTTIADY